MWLIIAILKLLLPKYFDCIPTICYFRFLVKNIKTKAFSLIFAQINLYHKIYRLLKNLIDYH
jgi:hypothetical protein